MMLSIQSLRRLVLRALPIAAVLTILPPAPAQTSIPSPRTILQTRTAAAVPSAVDAGPLPSSQRLSVTLTLAPTPDRAAALDAFLAALTTSSSSSYHQWLTPAQFAASYGATADQLAAAAAWAQAQGLSLDSTSPSATRIVVSGTVPQLQATFATPIHSFAIANTSYYGNTTQPSLTPDASALFLSVDGLDNLPSPALKSQSTTLTATALASLVDANTTSILPLTSALCTSDLAPAQIAAYTGIFRQAAAQGMTVFGTRTCNTGALPAALPDYLALALPGDLADSTTPIVARPGWQSAPGLPSDALRYTPDLTTSSLADFTAEITKLAGTGRLGNIAPVLYALAPTPKLYTQPDAAPAGTWEPATGLGLVDLGTLDKVYPRGTGQSFTSFQATNYSPIHGQGTSFTSTVTSGTGGATPTGTVSFTSSTGTVLGTATLVNGTGSITLTNLEGGNLTVSAVYSGDATYAPSTSPSGQLFVQPEPSALTVAIGGNPTIGSSYTVTVTDTASSGVGQPSGPITITVSGTSNAYTAALQPATASSASATVTIPATTAGTLTLSVMCTTSADFSCYNPYTTTVTIAKATPTLSISYSPNPPVSGASITLNAVVGTVGTAAAPTGSVTFFDNGTTLNAGQLNGGATTTTGTVPTTPTHSITATYAGDSNYNSVSTTGGSTSTGTINTTLALASSATTVTAGQNITFTATLAAASAGPANPTGSVTFLDNGSQIGISNLTGLTASFTTSSLSATVNHTITAVYSGDGYYGASTSNAVGLTSSNTSASTTTSLVISASNPVHGQNVTFTAVVSASNGGATPTGTVTFTNTASGTIGQGTLSNGVATFTTNQLPGGTSTFTAAYSGSSTYNASFSSASSVTLNPEPVVLAISVPVTATFGTPFTVTVSLTAASGVSAPTGTVTLTPQGTGYSGSSQAGVTGSTISSTGLAAVTVQATGAGTIAFTATYSGDKNFAAAGPLTSSASVAKVTSKVTLSFSPTTPVAGQSTTLIAKVSFASSIPPTGTVQFLNGGSVIGTAALDNTGTATFPFTFASGNQVLTAVYSGDTNYAGGTSPVANTITGTTPTAATLSINPNPAAPGALVTFTSTVGPTVNGVPPSGSVQFITAGQVLCTATLVNGTATCSITLSGTAAGTIVTTANYGGDGTYAASVSPAVNLVVSSPGGTLTATITPSTAAGGTTAFVTATVTAPNGVVPSGSIVATVSNAVGTNLSTASATIVATATNVANIIVPVIVPATAGTYTVSVSCVNTNFTCAATTLALVSTGGTTTGTKIATTTVLTATASTTITNGTTLTAVVTPASAGTAAISGTVVFYDGSTQIGIATVSAGTAANTAVATATVTLSASTTHSLIAIYSGDTNYAGSISSAITGTTGTSTGTTPTITLTANTTSGLAGGTIVLTASVTGVTSAGAVPTGIVTFYAAGTTPRILGTATLGQAGANLAVAVLSTTLITSGSQSVYSVYSGDTNFATATSNFLTIGLSDYNLTFVPPSLTLTAGTSGQTTIVLGLVNGFAGTVTFGCTPPPNTAITCSFAPTQLTGGGSTVMTISTVAAKLKQTQQASVLKSERVLAGISFAGLLCFFLPAGRRRRIPALLLVLIALALTSNLGCSDNSGNFFAPLTGGTPLGTAIVTVNTAGSDGVNTVRHDYPFQVTIQ